MKRSFILTLIIPVAMSGQLLANEISMNQSALSRALYRTSAFSQFDLGYGDLMLPQTPSSAPYSNISALSVLEVQAVNPSPSLEFEAWNSLKGRNPVRDPLLGDLLNFQYQSPLLDEYRAQVRVSPIFWDGLVNTRDMDAHTSADAQSFDETGISCGDGSVANITPEVLALEAPTNIQRCFDMRIPASTRSDERSRLQSDINSCECLRNLELTKPLMNQPLAANSFITSNQNLRNKINERVQEIVQNNLHSTMNGIFFTSALIFNETELTNAYAYSSNVFNNSRANPENGTSLNLSYAPKYSQVFEDEFPLPKGQCVSKREFFQSRMIPEDRDMIYIRAVIERGFEPHQWDYTQLQERYRNLMRKSPRERAEYQTYHEIISIKSRLKFLNRNPLVKYYLSSTDQRATQKGELFNHLKTALMDDGCQEINSACTEKFHGGLQSFFNNDANREIVRNGAREDINQRARREASRDIVSESSDFMNGRSRPANRNDLIRKFSENFNLGSVSPDSCHQSALRSPMDGAVASQCVDIFSAYCKTVDNYHEVLRNADNQHRGLSDEVIDDIEDDLDKELEDDFMPNLAENEDFQNYINKNCGQRATGRGIFRRSVDFGKFTEDRCKDGDQAACSIRSYRDLVRLRQEFYASHPVARGESVEKPAESLSNGSIVRTLGTQRYFTPERPTYDTFNGPANDLNIGNSTPQNLYANAETSEAPRTNRYSSFDRETSQEAIFNYSNLSNAGASAVAMPNTQVATTEAQRIEDMDQSSRQELLEDWEREYEAWKQNKNGNLSPSDQARDTELRTEISTLRALLDQQRQISEQQYQLLNEAIAARTRLEEENLARSRETERGRTERNEGRRVSEVSSSSASPVSDDIARGPASIAEPQMNGGSLAGSTQSGGASIGGSLSGNSSASASNSDSVAREEAKLVNLRRFSDGSIFIESTSSGGGSSANAITLPVSDEQYRILQTNPQGFNLSQIEKNIPREQIEQLERNGEIVLLLRNGQNPPFEVRLEKKDNKLVYSLKDSEGRARTPIKRVFTRNALLNNLTQ